MKIYHCLQIKPVSNLSGIAPNICKLLPVKIHWYTPASDSWKLKDRVEESLPLLPTAMFIGIVVTGTPSLNHCAIGGSYTVMSSPTWPAVKENEIWLPLLALVLLALKAPVVRGSWDIICNAPAADDKTE